ncbi:hypothetical protein AB0J57_13860 [Streptomyces sp. NPDC049837]|uniref:hypothetical protein n=1 Tax=Streptomyces sp. NPDC049837 TaxID=3155277 RepID=UPI0034259FB3
MGRRSLRARRWTWIGLAVVLLGLPGGCVIWGAYAWSEAGRTQQVPCTDALAFARATLPDTARDARCTAAHWQDTYVTADFRMPRAEAKRWLSATYPAAERSVSCETDLCLRAEWDDADLAAVDVEMTYEDGDTALVRLRAFDL